MTEPIVTILEGQPGAYVSLAEHEIVRQKKELAMDCLWSIAKALNRFSAAMDKIDATLETETRPAPL